MRPMGDVQKKVLSLLAEKGGDWSPRSGWYWSSRSATTKILESLIPRGFVVQTGDTFWITENGMSAYNVIKLPINPREAAIRADERKKIAQELLAEMNRVGKTIQPGVWHAAKTIDPSINTFKD